MGSYNNEKHLYLVHKDVLHTLKEVGGLGIKSGSFQQISPQQLTLGESFLTKSRKPMGQQQAWGNSGWPK